MQAQKDLKELLQYLRSPFHTFVFFQKIVFNFNTEKECFPSHVTIRQVKTWLIPTNRFNVSH